MKTAKRYLPVLLMLLLAIQAGVADAQNKALLWAPPTPKELKMLPPYCYARIGPADQATRNSWEQQMGKQIFLHLHHYCTGMNYMNRARLEMDTQRKNFYLQRASSELDYVIARWPPTYTLTAQAKKMKMQANMMIRK